MHNLLLTNHSHANEIQVMDTLKHEIGHLRTVYFMYHLYLMNDLQIMTTSAESPPIEAQKEEEELASYIEQMHAQILQPHAQILQPHAQILQPHAQIHAQNDFEVYPNPFEFVDFVDGFNKMELDISSSSSTASTPSATRFKCDMCSKSFASTDGARKHYKKIHGNVNHGPRNYCVPIQ